MSAGGASYSGNRRGNDRPARALRCFCRLTVNDKVGLGSPLISRDAGLGDLARLGSRTLCPV